MAKGVYFSRESADRIARDTRRREGLVDALGNPIGHAAVPQLNVWRRVRLAEDHPGKGVLMDVYIEMAWDAANHTPIFDETRTLKALDPFSCYCAGEGDTYWATPRASDAHGYVWIIQRRRCTCHADGDCFGGTAEDYDITATLPADWSDVLCSECDTLVGPFVLAHIGGTPSTPWWRYLDMALCTASGAAVWLDIQARLTCVVANPNCCQMDFSVVLLWLEPPSEFQRWNYQAFGGVGATSWTVAFTTYVGPGGPLPSLLCDPHDPGSMSDIALART